MSCLGHNGTSNNLTWAPNCLDCLGAEVDDCRKESTQGPLESCGYSEETFVLRVSWKTCSQTQETFRKFVEERCNIACGLNRVSELLVANKGMRTRIVNFNDPHTNAATCGCEEMKVSIIFENSWTDCSTPNRRDETQRALRLALTLSISAVNERIDLASGLVLLLRRVERWVEVRVAWKSTMATSSGSELCRYVSQYFVRCFL